MDQTIQKVMQLIKGESSFWINKQGILSQSSLGSSKVSPSLVGEIEKFQWQDEYFAVSVSESILDRVRNYIKNQEQHHSKKSFDEEYDEFIIKYGFQKFND